MCLSFCLGNNASPVPISCPQMVKKDLLHSLLVLFQVFPTSTEDTQCLIGVSIVADPAQQTVLP